MLPAAFIVIYIVENSRALFKNYLTYSVIQDKFGPVDEECFALDNLEDQSTIVDNIDSLHQMARILQKKSKIALMVE